MTRLLFTLLLLFFSTLSHADPGADFLIIADRNTDVLAADTSPSGEFIVAVGEDASERTKKLQMMDEHHEAVILVSTDSGKQWARMSAGGGAIPFDSIIVMDEKRAVISGAMEGAGGIIMLTENRGRDWKTVYEGGMIHDLARNGNESIWAAGYGLMRSEDGGGSWNPVDLPEIFYYAIHAVDENILVAAGDKGVIRTTDAGMNWSPVSLPDNMGGFNRIEQLAGKIRLTSWNDETLVSDDGGKSWRHK